MNGTKYETRAIKSQWFHFDSVRKTLSFCTKPVGSEAMNWRHFSNRKLTMQANTYHSNGDGSWGFFTMQVKV